jgi:hypothetical protein
MFGIGFGEVILFAGFGLAIAGVVRALKRGGGIEKELGALARLHKAGTLSDAEHESARAKVLDRLAASDTGAAVRPAPKPSGARTLFSLAILAGLLWVGSRVFLGADNTSRIVATVTQTPIEVYNGVENVRATSWRAVPINLPYTGRLTLSVNVKNGNGLDVFLIPPGEIDALKAEKQFRTYDGFSASKTRTFRQSQRLEQGSYYVVLRDTTLGILSAGSTDVEVRARLEP